MHRTLFLGVSNLEENNVFSPPSFMNRAELLGSMTVSFRGKVFGFFIMLFAFTSHISAKVIGQVKCYSINNNKNSTININVGNSTSSTEPPKNDGKPNLLLLIIVLGFFVLIVFGLVYPEKIEILFNSFLEFLKNYTKP
jgi:hypothetical protein